MQKIVIRHLSGARADQVDEFPASGARELIVGRDTLASVKFDPDLDDLVSRQHVKIVHDSADPEGYQLVDLQSRNGTFLNRTRVYGVVRLNHDDVVQLGAGGPEFRFEIFPPPLETGARPTREASREMLADLDLKSTRESWLQVPGPPRPVGRGTVERMLGDVFTRVKRESNRSLWVGLMALIAILAVGSVIWLYLRKTQADQAANQQQNAVSLQQMNEQLKRSPADMTAMKEQIANLEAQLQQAGQRTDAAQQANRELLNELRQKLEQANREIPQARFSPPPQTTAPPVAFATFDSLFEQATDQYQRGHPKEALELVTQALAKDDKRWEGYELAGRLATALDSLPEAADMYEKALRLAPAASRPDMQSKLDDLKRRMETK